MITSFYPTTLLYYGLYIVHFLTNIGNFLPVIFALKGLPLMWLSPALMDILYSPGAGGMYVTLMVPSLLSWHVTSAFDGPSTFTLIFPKTR